MTEPTAVPRHTNRLARETSPYLLQHAHNPVDWHPWGEEALARARSEDRPIFLSIGYAACHWCHVMERESFEDEATARQLNSDFVPIKVDREERPEIDAIYMEALQAMTGQGGWPLNVFLTPGGRPFYGGTYFPDQPRHGLPSFRQVLDGVATAWRERRAEIEQAGEELARSIAQPTAQPADAPAEWMLESAVLALERSFDARLGGWGRAPKFPQPMTVEFLLAQHVRTGDQRPLAMARRTLDAMAAGGIYDHLGGGFARYATDAGWLVPHFEKMLYDNALLARVYVHAWQLTGEPRYREVAEETLAFIGRDLADPDGGFVASLDADTDGEEGATYVWTKDEIDALLGPDAAAFDAAYGVTAEGNWEGRTILARAVGGTVDSALEDGLRRSRQRLAEARQLRPQPARDDKVLAAWNGLAIAAFADAGRALDEPGLIQTGARAAEFVLANMRDERGRLLRSYRSGAARHAGVLEDHAHLADGLLALYRATFDERWFGHAVELVELILADFADPGGGYFDTAADHEQLIARPKGLQDNALPSGNAMTARVLIELAALTGEGHYRAAADAALRLVTPYVHRHPTAFAQWLVAMQPALGPLDEVAVVGDRSAPATAALLEVVQRPYRPAVVVAFAEAGAASSVPLLAGRPQRGGVPTAYVCHGFACRQPVTKPADLVAQLSSPGV